MKSLNNLLVFLLTILSFTSISFSTTPLPGMRGTPNNLPDISVIGDFYSAFSKDYSEIVTVRSIETAFQGYIYPEVRSDIFLALHRHEEALEFELCEGYVSFLKLFGKLSAEVGRRHVEFGKVNKIHQHHRPYFDQPIVITNYLGEHGLVGDGLNLKYLLPLNFFAEVSFGGWEVPKAHTHQQETEETHQHSNFINDRVYTSKIWFGFPLAKVSELELGFNYLLGKGPHYIEHKDEISIFSAEVNYKWIFSTYRNLTLQSELFWLTRSVPVETFKRFGGYLFTNLQLSKYWSLAARYDYVELPNPEEINITQALSLIVTKNLTETTLIRGQYTYDITESEHKGVVQFVFGIGPHSHMLE